MNKYYVLTDTEIGEIVLKIRASNMLEAKNKVLDKYNVKKVLNISNQPFYKNASKQTVTSFLGKLRLPNMNNSILQYKIN